jgi:alkanesulfonate monooxygenase SsuD/methylene tetrahydromethanopterin reductase-like flavin-dependent oxidoreductase (luciferase family)
VLLAGMVPAALRRAGQLAAGWLSSSRADLTRIGEQAAIVCESAQQAGRDPAAMRVVCRGVVMAGVFDSSADRAPLTGSYEQIRADTSRLAEHGVTEVFYDLNWDPQIGSPAADPVAGVRRATEILEGLAPARGPVG